MKFLNAVVVAFAVVCGAGAARGQGNVAAVVDQAARAALPAPIREAGTLKVATSLQWPPFDFKGDDGQPDGLDIRLVKAIAARLGLSPAFTDVKFPAIVPGVATGRFDIGVDQLNDTPERRKAVRFVDYYMGGYGLLVRKDGPSVDVAHLCGHTLALTQGSSQVAMAEQASKDCQARNEPPIAMLYYPDSADTYLAVANGRGDGFLTDEAVGLYIAQHNDRLVMRQGSLPGVTAAAGIVVDRDNTALATALRLALASLQRDGSYGRILDQYGVGDMALSAAELDAQH